MPLTTFFYGACSGRDTSKVLSYITSQTISSRQWAEVKVMVGNPQKHVCGGALYDDLTTFLERNYVLSDTVVNYVPDIQQMCSALNTTS